MRKIALMILGSFYAFYFGKKIGQRRRGIVTDQLGKGRGRTACRERVLKAATYGVVLVELVSIVKGRCRLPHVLRIVGACLGILGDVIFAVSLLSMRDNWRAGLAVDDATSLVTGGIYRFSRNPAFLAFDFVYLSLLLLFFNGPLLVASLLAVLLLHFQVLAEERHLTQVFGQPYLAYMQQTPRYFGIVQLLRG